MEPEAAKAPLKVCRKCAVATRTEAASCPSCGSPYQRRRSVWWLAVPAVAIAFAIGYGGRTLLGGDDESASDGITLKQGAAVPRGISRDALVERLGGRSPVVEQERAGRAGACVYYPISDRDGSVWEFCFEGGSLVGARTLAE
jgi:hypothetical protein